MADYAAQQIGANVFFKEIVSPQKIAKGIYRYNPATPQGPPFLSAFKDFKMPEKVYGAPLDKLTNKVLNTFKKKQKNVGVLLSGIKGTGKSVQMKHIAMKSQMPCIIVDSAVHGSELVEFLNQSPSPCVVLFDEFEKMYRREEEQHTILPLLDGVSQTPHIFVLTINGEVSEFMMGRPGRIRYNVRYDSLDESLIKEIIEDSLDDPAKIRDVYRTAALLDGLNIDSLVSLLEEINLYPEESVSDIVETFNLEDPMSVEYDFTYFIEGLVCTNQEEYSKVQVEVSKILHKDGRATATNLLLGRLDKEIDIVSKKFRGLLEKAQITAIARGDRLSNAVNPDQFEIRLETDYENANNKNAITNLTGEYLCLEGHDMSFKINANNAVDLYCDGRHIARGKKTFKAAHKFRRF